MDFKELRIRGAKVMGGGYRGFRGGRYGYSFCVDLSEAESVEFGGKAIADTKELIDLLEQDRWDVKWTTPTSDAYEPTPFIQVKINFNNKFRQPYVIVDDIAYDEKMLPQLQEARFSHVDVAISPARPTERRDGSLKRTAYLVSLHVDLFNADGDYEPERYADPFAK